MKKQYVRLKNKVHGVNKTLTNKKRENKKTCFITTLILTNSILLMKSFYNDT